MSLQETMDVKAETPAHSAGRVVELTLHESRLILAGAWEWPMHTDAVFCSDVMLFPESFRGTKCLLHPDDKNAVLAVLRNTVTATVAQLQFRVITTYGDVFTLVGQNLNVTSDPAELFQNPMPPAWTEAEQLQRQHQEVHHLLHRQYILDAAEKIHDWGTWYIIPQTHQVFYSDNMFRLHGLAAQSLNPHANTFHSFIYPADQATVIDTLEKSYTLTVPVHLEYRIVKLNGDVRHVQLVTNWSYNRDGQHMCSGVLRDITDQVLHETAIENAAVANSFQQTGFQYLEQQTHTASWYVNLATRKTTFSDHYFRLYGIRKGELPQHDVFLALVHPDDVLRVAEAVQSMYRHHTPPEISYRIIRADGKIRHLKLAGKIQQLSSVEQVMVGFLHDVTVQLSLNARVQALSARLAMQTALTNAAEDVAEQAAVLWQFPTDAMQWSDGFFKMLGLKPGAVAPAHQLFQKAIHPADADAFGNAILQVSTGVLPEPLCFRMLSTKGMQQVKLTFRSVVINQQNHIAGIVQSMEERTQLQLQNRQQQQLLDMLMHAMFDMVVVTASDNSVVVWNTKAEEYTGLKAATARHQNLFELLPHLKTEKYLARLHAALGGEPTQNIPAENAYVKGHHNFTLVPLVDNDGNVPRVLHIVHDVSKEYELQDHLTERISFIENLVEASIDRIVALDRNMNYLYWNKQAELHYGLRKNQVLGKNILEVFPVFRNDPTYLEFRRVLKGETVHFQAPPHKGNTSVLETFLLPVKDAGENVVAVLWLVRDLTSLFALQEDAKKESKFLYPRAHRPNDET